MLPGLIQSESQVGSADLRPTWHVDLEIEGMTVRSARPSSRNGCGAIQASGA